MRRGLEVPCERNKKDFRVAEAQRAVGRAETGKGPGQCRAPGPGFIGGFRVGEGHRFVLEEDSFGHCE